MLSVQYKHTYMFLKIYIYFHQPVLKEISNLSLIFIIRLIGAIFKLNE